MTSATKLSFGSLSVAASADERPPLDWLEHFLRPWFGNEGGGENNVSVELAIDPARFAQETGRDDSDSELADTFVLDARLVALPVTYRDKVRTCIDDEDLGAVYEVRPPAGVRVIVPADGAGSRVAFMRAVREMVMIDSRASGFEILHAAGVVIGGSGVAFVGPRRSGKTSLLLHVLLTSDAAFMANDRMVARDTPEGVVANGLPTIVALRGDTVDRFPKVATRLRDLPARHWLTRSEWLSRVDRPWSTEGAPIDLAPTALCDALGVPIEPLAPLRAVVFPSIDATVDVRTCRRLDGAEALMQLRKGIVGADLPTRHADALWPARSAGMELSEDADGQLRSIARLPCFELRQGARAYEEPSLPDEILGHLA